MAKRSAGSHRTAIPDNEIVKLMLKALDTAECFLTNITDRAEVAAANSAREAPSMTSLKIADVLKTNLSILHVYNDYNEEKRKKASYCSVVNHTLKVAWHL
ncbi:MAG: hypothetical protein QW674_07195 [Candidatus Bathyarchaeia archaeon]